MVSQSIAKTASLMLAAVCIAIFLAVPNPVALSKDFLCSRLTYHFFHASFLHLSLNLWCLLSLVFISNVGMPKIILAFTIASAVPNASIPADGAIGLSALLFSLFGLTAPFSPACLSPKAVLSYALPLTPFFILPNMAGAIHLFCFAAGSLVAFFTNPFSKAC